MALPPQGIDAARRAAKLGWVSKRQAERAIRIATANACNGGHRSISAIEVLREQGLLDEEALEAMVVERPKPTWWRRRTQGKPLLVVQRHIGRGEASPDLLEELRRLDPDAFLTNLTRCLPARADLARFGARELARYEQPGDLRLIGWHLDVDGLPYLVEADLSPRWSRHLQPVPERARLRIESRSVFGGVGANLREIRVWNGDAIFVNFAHQADGVDPGTRYAGVVRVLRATLDAAGGVLDGPPA